jgi:hypothetical protein
MIFVLDARASDAPWMRLSLQETWHRYEAQFEKDCGRHVVHTRLVSMKEFEEQGGALEITAMDSVQSLLGPLDIGEDAMMNEMIDELCGPAMCTKHASFRPCIDPLEYASNMHKTIRSNVNERSPAFSAVVTSAHSLAPLGSCLGPWTIQCGRWRWIRSPLWPAIGFQKRLRTCATTYTGFGRMRRTQRGLSSSAPMYENSARSLDWFSSDSFGRRSAMLQACWRRSLASHSPNT